MISADCEIAVNLLKESAIHCCDIEGIVCDIKILAAASGCHGFNFVKRDANCLAHNLAKRVVLGLGSSEASGVDICLDLFPG